MLALSSGINAAIFSVFAHVLLAPLHFPDPSNLYLVRSHAPSLGDARRAASGSDFRDPGTTLSQVAAAIGYFTEPGLATALLECLNALPLIAIL
jgi:hypothetical protein